MISFRDKGKAQALVDKVLGKSKKRKERQRQFGVEVKPKARKRMAEGTKLWAEEFM